MILRSVTQHVKDQNWFAVGLDFLIVVIGVFIGIQVANWNEERVAAIAESHLMLRLAEEFDIIEPELAKIEQDLRATVEATGQVIMVLREGEPPADDPAFRKLLAQSNFVRRLPSVSATYQGLLATGGISSIKSAELRAALTSYGNLNAQVDREYENAYGTVFHLQARYFEAVQWTVNSKEWNGDNAIDSYDWDTLLGAKGELQTWLVFQVDLMQFAQSQLVEVREILALLRDDKL